MVVIKPQVGTQATSSPVPALKIALSPPVNSVSILPFLYTCGGGYIAGNHKNALFLLVKFLCDMVNMKVLHPAEARLIANVGPADLVKIQRGIT